MDDPVFDEAVTIEFCDIDRERDSQIDLVIHRDIQGRIACYHSPLANGAVTCKICEGGARVYVS